MTNSSIIIPTKNNPTEKQCTKCGQIFPLTKEFFHRDKLTKDGFHYYCKVCSLKRVKEYYQNNKDKMKEQMKEYRESNKDKLKKYRESNKEKLKKYLYSPCLFNSVLAQRLSIYDETKENQGGYLESRCLYCGKWIQPTVSQIINRLSACETPSVRGEHRIYCNDNNNQCKLACPTYKQKSYPKGFKPATSREVEPLIRQLCFERDNWTCQHCGVTSREAQLHCHHIIGVVHSPIEQNDISNTITLCKACHKALHKKSGCTYQDYKCA